MKRILFLVILALVLLCSGASAISIVVNGDSTVRGAAAYGSREDTAPSGWTPTFSDHSGTIAGEIQNNMTTGNTVYNNAIGGEVSGVPGSNGALSNAPEGLRNRWARDSLGKKQTDLTDGRPTTNTPKPDLIVVGVGINDCVYNGSSYGGYSWTLDTTEDNLYWMAQNATDNGIKTIFLVPEPAAGYCSITYQTSLKSWMLSNLSGVTRVYNTWTLLNDPNNNGYMKSGYNIDNVHPNDAAWVYLTSNLVKVYPDWLSPQTFAPYFTISSNPKISGTNLLVPISISNANASSISATNADTGESYTASGSNSNISLSRTGNFASGPYAVRMVYPDRTYIVRGNA